MTTLDELQARCARSSLKKTEADAGEFELLCMAALWLASEAGEVATEARKALVGKENHWTVRARLREEIGDVLWCVAEVATLANLTLEECAAAQRAKQERRYADVIALHDTEGPT